MILSFIMLMLFLQEPETTVTVDGILHEYQDAVSLSLRADGSMVVAQDGKSSVILTNANGTEIKRIGGKGWGAESFDRPADVSSAFLLDLFVTDPMNRRVMQYDKELQFIRSFDESMLPNGSRMTPVASCAAVSGALFVLDADDRRVLRFSPRGIVEKDFGTIISGRSGILDPRDITVTTEDEVLVLDGQRVLIFDLFGNHLRTFDLGIQRSWRTLSADGRRIVVTSNETIVILHQDTGRLIELTAASIVGAGKEPFRDAVLVRETLYLLTATSLYRCTISLY